MRCARVIGLASSRGRGAKCKAWPRRRPRGKQAGPRDGLTPTSKAEKETAARRSSLEHCSALLKRTSTPANGHIPSVALMICIKQPLLHDVVAEIALQPRMAYDDERILSTLSAGLNHDIFDTPSNTTRRAKSSSLRLVRRLRSWLEWWDCNPPYPAVECRKRYATRVFDMPLR